MNWHRIQAMIYRHFTELRHSYDRFSDMFYWPALDLLIWGLTGLYLARLNPNSSHYLEIILNGLIFWVIIWRAQYEISTNVLSELWGRNLTNIFAAPLTVWEWMTSFMIFGFFKTIISVTFSAGLAYLFYRYNIFIFGWYLFPIFVSLLLTGWAGGLFVAGFLIRFGGKIQTIAWAGIALVAPFSAIYYPVSVLPQWAQKVAWFIPSTYIFEALRQFLFIHTFPVSDLLISLLLDIIYLPLAIIFFAWMFRKSVALGLGRLI